MTPDIILPKSVRRIILFVAGVIGLGLGAAAVWFSSVGSDIPTVLIQITAVFSFVSAAPMFLAVANINKDEPTEQGDTSILDDPTDVNGESDAPAGPVDVEPAEPTPPAEG